MREPFVPLINEKISFYITLSIHPHPPRKILEMVKKIGGNS